MNQLLNTEKGEDITWKTVTIMAVHNPANRLTDAAKNITSLAEVMQLTTYNESIL